MSQATADPTLEALVPRGSVRRSLTLVVLALALLAAVWLLPPVLLPTVGTVSQASWREFAADRQVVLVAGIEPHGAGGVRLRSVRDVPGAHVLAAWAVDAAWLDGDDTPAGMGSSSATDPSVPEYVASLGLTDSDLLPRTVAADGAGTLVVLWQIDDCAALTSTPLDVVVASRWGAARTVALGFTPFTADDHGTDAEGPCAS